MGLYANDGSINVTVVDGNSYVGAQAADGSLNVLVVDGSDYTGLLAGCGAVNVIAATEDTNNSFHSCGAWLVSETPFFKGAVRVTVVSGSLGATETLTLTQSSPEATAVPEFAIAGITGEAVGNVVRITVNGIDYDTTLDLDDLTSLTLTYAFPVLANGSHTAQAFHFDSGMTELQRSAELTFSILDVTAPVISSPTASVVSSTVLQAGFSTDSVGGTAYVVASSSATVPTDTQIIAGQDHTGASAPSGSGSITASGANTVNVTVSDFTTRYLHIVHRDAGLNKSNVITSASITPYATPTEVTGMQHWYDLGDAATVTVSSGGVSSVADKIGSLALAPGTPSSAQHRPLYNGTQINGRNVAVFNNTGTTMNLGWYTTLPTGTNSGNFYIGIVVMIDGVTSTTSDLFGLSDSTNPRYDFQIRSNGAATFPGRLNVRELGTSANFSSGLSLSTLYFIEAEFTASTNVKIYVNGNTTAVATVTHAQAAMAATTAYMFANSGAGNPLYGKLCEVFIGNQLVVGGSQYAGLKTGINTRWGTSL